MRSIVDVTIGQASRTEEYVAIPLYMTVSDDDDDEDHVPMIHGAHMDMLIGNQYVKQGLEVTLDRVVALLNEHMRFKLAGGGYQKLHKALCAYLEKNDLTPLVADWFPDPTSTTRH